MTAQGLYCERYTLNLQPSSSLTRSLGAPINLFDNAIGIGGPDKGFGFAVMLAEVAVDRRLQVDERMEGAALQSPTGQRGEKAFDRVGQGHEVGVKWNTHLGCRVSQARTLGCLWTA